ncbi:hypothetical protein CDL15_Pgr019463 [Punica granatum]|uniref:Uncharacterized protein n=1 Tax=Punica granatum TaxID=22663 RepID=A0A218VSI6_PUNGR|nr:hypothetical protein CDL15_Pgr019463 [Punica granatum]PKI62839.1 hypothetical protein CRG98_016790 [Punica granatum]
MKSPYPSGDSSLTHETKRTIRERLKQAYEAAVISVATPDHQTTRIPISKEIERRKTGHRVEEPIRTIMFLGSWSHT